MKVLTDTLCKEHYDLYTEIHGSIAVSQIRVAQKDFILLSSPPPHSSIPAGTYSIDDFNTKIKEFVLQQRQDWEPSQIKD